MKPDITTQHPEYAAYAERWARCRDFRSGQDAVLEGGYLKKPMGMEDAQFDFYKSRAYYMNPIGRTIQALVGTLMRSAPVVEGFPKRFEDHLEDMTLGDESFNVVASMTAAELMTVGRVGILLDMSIDGGQRPYSVIVPAERIINWRTERVDDDPNRLVLLVIREDAQDETENIYEHKSKPRYRELVLNDEGVYQARVWNEVKDGKFEPEEWIVPVRLGDPLDFIPFTFFGTDSITPRVSKPPLLDMVNAARAHLFNSADREQSLYFVSQPTAWTSGATGDTPLKIGSAVAWNLPKDAKAGMLEHSGHGIGAIREAMEEKALHMAALGARLLETPRTGNDETATAVRVRHSGDEAALSFIGSAISSGLTQLLRRHVWWSDSGDLPMEITVEVSDKFLNMRATPEEVKVLVLELQAEAISYETFYAQLMDGGWAREGVTVEEEQAAIRAGGGGTPAPLDVGDSEGGEDDS